MRYAGHDVELEPSEDGVIIICKDVATQTIVRQLHTQVKASQEVITAFNTGNREYWRANAEARRVHVELLHELTILPNFFFVNPTEPLHQLITNAVREMARPQADAQQ